MRDDMSDKFTHQPISEYISSTFNPAEFDAKQWQLLCWCKTAEDCTACLERSEFADAPLFCKALKSIRVRLRASDLSCTDEFDHECLICLINYEEVRDEVSPKTYRANRTFKSGKNNGWKQMIINTVTKRKAEDAAGFVVLKAHGLLEHSFEAFVIDNDTHFDEVVVSKAKKRLQDAGYLK